MEEAGRIEQDTVDAAALGLAYRRHRLTFTTCVEDVEAHAQLARLLAQQRIEFPGRRRAVELGLAAAQRLHVGPLDEQQLHFVLPPVAGFLFALYLALLETAA